MPDKETGKLSSEQNAFAFAISEIRGMDAAAAKTIGYMPKTLIDTTLPHRRPVDEKNRCNRHRRWLSGVGVSGSSDL